MRVRSVTLLHGFLGLPSSLSGFARALRTELGVPIRSVLLPGHGSSPWGLEASTFDAAVSALRDRVFTRAADGEVLVGYSMGGRLALALGAAEPGVARVIAIGAHLGIRDEAERASRVSEDDRRADAVCELGLERFAETWSSEPIFASQRGLAHDVLSEQALARASHTERGIAWALRTLSTGRMPDLRERLEASRTQVALLAGSLDAKFVAHHASVERARLPNVRVGVVPGCGHNTVLEDLSGSVAAVRAALHVDTNHSLSINGA